MFWQQKDKWSLNESHLAYWWPKNITLVSKWVDTYAGMATREVLRVVYLKRKNALISEHGFWLLGWRQGQDINRQLHQKHNNGVPRNHQLHHNNAHLRSPIPSWEGRQMMLAQWRVVRWIPSDGDTTVFWAMWSRCDICLMVTFLTTRVKDWCKDDWKNLTIFYDTCSETHHCHSPWKLRIQC